jgi:hypothetical protein
LVLSDPVSRKTRQAQQKSMADARDTGSTWEGLTRQRLEAAKRGEWSPWLGIKQWAQEIPLNMNIRGYDSGAAHTIDAREAAFQAEKKRLEDAAAAGVDPGMIHFIPSGVK